MSSLQQQLEAKRAAEASCVNITTRDGAPFVEFHVTAHARCGFPVGQLCHYTLESNEGGGNAPPERLTLAFPTADVVVLGARLAKLVEAVHERALAAVMPLDARYAGTLGKQPWVASVAISRLDKSSGIAG
ncbi:MAG TPA: hypothetical protein VJP76_02985 [Candidatus Tumulicola sp.]|nr:hypothetical protein [Candidatus Tumulicola sp.]